MEMLPEGQKNTTDVTLEDQQKINTFSKLIGRKDTLSLELEKQVTEKEYLDDLAMEIELLDEDEVGYKVGDVFVTVDKPTAVEWVERDLALVEERVLGVEERILALDLELDLLKTFLYAKFGDAINLER